MPGYSHYEVAGDRLWGPDRFSAAVEQFTTGMLGLQQEGIIEGAFIHGRAAAHLDEGWFDTDERSDLDVVIIPTAKDAKSLAAIRKVAADIYAAHLIELEPWCFTRDQLADGDHNLDGSFKAWMEALIASQPDGNQLSDPIKGIYVKPQEEVVSSYRGERDLDRYFGQRFEFEQTYLRGTFHDAPSLLDHVLRFPFETGREVVGHLRYLGILPPELASLGLERTAVSEITQNLFTRLDPRLAAMYEDIQHDNALYTGLLRDVRDGKITESEYGQLIHATLVDVIPRMLEVTNRYWQAYKKYCSLQNTSTALGLSLATVSDAHAEKLY